MAPSRGAEFVLVAYLPTSDWDQALELTVPALPHQGVVRLCVRGREKLLGYDEALLCILNPGDKIKYRKTATDETREETIKRLTGRALPGFELESGELITQDDVDRGQVELLGYLHTPKPWV